MKIKNRTRKASLLIGISNEISENLNNFENENDNFFDEKIDEKNQSISVVFPHTFLATNNHLLKWVGNQDNKEEALPLYYDDDHLNSLGSIKLVSDIFENLE